MTKKVISLHTIENKWNIDRHTLRKWKGNEDQLKLVDKKENQLFIEIFLILKKKIYIIV